LAEFSTSPPKDLLILFSAFYYVSWYFFKTYDTAKKRIDGDTMAVEVSVMGFDIIVEGGIIQ